MFGRKLFLPLFAVSLFANILLMGCANPRSESGGSPVGGDTAEQEPLSPADQKLASTLFDKAVRGQWSQGCKVVGKASAETALKFEGLNSGTQITIGYADRNCAGDVRSYVARPFKYKIWSFVLPESENPGAPTVVQSPTDEANPLLLKSPSTFEVKFYYVSSEAAQPTSLLSQFRYENEQISYKSEQAFYRVNGVVVAKPAVSSVMKLTRTQGSSEDSQDQ